MSRRPWTQQRIDRAWRRVGWLCVLATALGLFAGVAAIMAYLTDPR